MRLLIAFLIVGFLYAANPVITQTAPPTPASLVTFADKGDLTYCVATASKTVPQFSLVCRRNGVQRLPAVTISETVEIGIGDVFWIFFFDKANPNLIHFSSSVNVRDAQGLYINSVLKSQGDALWTVGKSNTRSWRTKLSGVVLGR